MQNLVRKLWNDDAGIVALEYLLVATIIGLGLVVGLIAVSEALNAELVELANAILAIDQSYSYTSQSSSSNNGNGLGSKAGSNGVDTKEKDSYGFPSQTANSIDVNP